MMRNRWPTRNSLLLALAATLALMGGVAAWAQSTSSAGPLSVTITVTEDGPPGSPVSNELTAVVTATEPEPVGGGDRDGRPSLPKDVEAGETPIAPDTGASVTFDEGRLVVEIPAGALAEEGTLLLDLIPESELPALPEGAITLASIYRVRIMVGDTPVRSFSAPIRLTFRIDPPLLTDIPSDEIYGSYWDEGLQTWLALPTRIDPSGEIVVIVDHLTPLTVLHRPDLPVLTDIEDHWAEADTLRLVSLGAIEGYPDGTFRPEQSITRAEFVKLVAESLGLDSRSDAGSLFADAIPDWAAASITAVVRAGLVKGYPDGTFRPQSAITRQEVAVILARWAEAGLTRQAEDLNFADATDIPDWARLHVRTVQRLGLMEGYPDGTFRPHASITRAESAATLWRAIQVLNRP